MSNTRYYLDTEFNSFGGSLISLGIVHEDGEGMYLVVPYSDIERMNHEEAMEPWINVNVIPHIYDCPEGHRYHILSAHLWGPYISDFIYRDEKRPPQIFVDWPSDAMDFAKLLIAGPGRAVPMQAQTHITILRHLDVYPTTLPGAIQHHALWDAMAIRHLLMELEA